MTTFMRDRPAGVHTTLPVQLSRKHLPMLCTIQIMTQNRLASGGLGASVWDDVPGMIDIPCRFGEDNSTEPRFMWGQSEEQQSNVFLGGRYDGINPAIHRLKLGDRIFNITGVTGDSSFMFTVLRVRTYEPTVEEGR